MTDAGRRCIVVDGEGAGSRLDSWVAARTGISRSRAARLVLEGRVLVNGAARRKSEPVSEGDTVEVGLPEPRPSTLAAEPIPLNVVYEDDYLLVVDKAAGMVVHPAPGHRSGTLVNALLHHLGKLPPTGGDRRPGIVHRLDRDTSGLLVVARDVGTHSALSEALRARRIRRIYLAASWGHLPMRHMRVDAPVGRDAKDRKRMAVRASGRRAVTRIRVRESWTAAELLDVALETGRTHQIRVHLSHIGHPVVGDAAYGPGRERGMDGPARGWARELARRCPRQFLHAARLGFDHPVTGEPMRFRSPLPPDLRAVAAWARGEPSGEPMPGSGRAAPAAEGV